MPIDPKRFKHDERSPQELAKAILDHEFAPAGAEAPRVSFREQMLRDRDGDVEIEHGTALLSALSNLERTTPDRREDADALRHALEVINTYRKESAAFRDFSKKEANDPGPRELQRASADSMEAFMVEIANANSIEKLVRTLARKLGISLIEPGRPK